MTSHQKEYLNLEEVPNHIGTMFLFDTPLYKVKDREIYFAQYNFVSDEDLRPKMLWSIFKKEQENRSIETVTQEFIDDANGLQYVRDVFIDEPREVKR